MEGDLIFGDSISMNLMFLDGKAVLHVVASATRFSAATFLDAHGMTYGHSVDGIWIALGNIWWNTNVGYTNRILKYKGVTQ